eukprot:16769-Heterococcus_DN1.PRE.3
MRYYAVQCSGVYECKLSMASALHANTAKSDMRCQLLRPARANMQQPLLLVPATVAYVLR